MSSVHKEKFEDTLISEALQVALQSYHNPGAKIRIVNVSLASPDPKRSWGVQKDAPRPGHQTGGHPIEINTWVLGRESPANTVERVSEGAVVQRVPLGLRRPDVATSYPGVSGAETPTLWPPSAW